MSLFPRPRWIKLLRLPALGMLMLVVLVNPVLAAVGDLHESSHADAGHAQPADAHGHADHADHNQPHGVDQEESTDLLHAFMHAAHCCGHLTAIPSTPFVPHAPLFADAAPVPDFAAPHSPPRTDPFRPPIAI